MPPHCLRLAGLVALLWVVPALVQSAPRAVPAWVAALRDGGYVIVVRHGATYAGRGLGTPGTGDALNFASRTPSTGERLPMAADYSAASLRCLGLRCCTLGSTSLESRSSECRHAFGLSA